MLAKSYQIFLEVSSLKSFTKAAKSMNLTVSAISKQIKLLENELGTILFHRTTRSLELTTQGLKLKEALNQSTEVFSGIIDEIRSEQNNISGVINLNVPYTFGEEFLIDIFAKFNQIYPKIILNIYFSDDVISPSDRIFDVIIRIGKLRDSTLIATKLTDLTHGIYIGKKSAQYNSDFVGLEQLNDLPICAYSNAIEGITVSEKNKSLYINSDKSIVSNNFNILKRYILDGKCYGILPDLFLRSYLESGEIRKLFPNSKISLDRSVYLIYPTRRFMPTRVRTLVEFLKQKIPSSIL